MGAYLQLSDPGLVPGSETKVKAAEAWITQAIIECMDIIPPGMKFTNEYFVRISGTYNRTDHIEYLRSLSMRVLDYQRYNFKTLQVQIASMARQSGGDLEVASQLLSEWLDDINQNPVSSDLRCMYNLTNRGRIQELIIEGRVKQCG